MPVGAYVLKSKRGRHLVPRYFMIGNDDDDDDDDDDGGIGMDVWGWQSW